MAGTVLLNIDKGVATLTLNRPAALNALSLEMMEDLGEAVRRLAAAEGVEVVVLTGAGDHFMAGGDLRDFARHLGLPAEERRAVFQRMIELHINPSVHALQALPQPVIARVRGACAGFGLSLVLGCDMAICADTTVFTTAYAAIALSGDGGVSWLLSRTLGRRKAAELLLLGERFDAAEALRLGLVNRVLADDALDAGCAALVARLQAGPRHAYAEIKRLLGSAGELPLGPQLQAEAEAFARCAATADFAEGVSAFLDKRKAVFRGS
ncbi:enoyl-CoA hydratase/isomerase family protein [Pseudothauera lacus]|uniref:Enoyl-CoA hydratase n=1 Tax=Pseudothauera lacus TaxID=2136175 RepID=A0A2T4IDU2_9RHOO|nr:enoyl-CoA hydratase-related protein [Pseudothauera lacus]PTD95934.1 enoyl-CoA hydratase [Pseudothauera lacus]